MPRWIVEPAKWKETDTEVTEDIWRACRKTEREMQAMFGNRYFTVIEWGNEQ